MSPVKNQEGPKYKRGGEQPAMLFRAVSAAGGWTHRADADSGNTGLQDCTPGTPDPCRLIHIPILGVQLHLKLMKLFGSPSSVYIEGILP